MPKIVVLVSGSGSNLQSIIDAINLGDLDCNIAGVIADRDCYGLTRAKEAGITAYLVDRKTYREELSQEIDKLIPQDSSLIVLAGFLSILDNAFIDKWQDRIINIHPSLLPKFGGHGMWGNRVHEAVLASGETESGCTVHLVTSEIDCGQIVVQQKVPVLKDDTVESLRLRVQKAEHVALINAIKIASNKIAV